MNQRPYWLSEDRRRWDHVRIHIEVIDDSRLAATDVALYTLLARHAELTSGQTEKTQSWLAERLQISERSVRYSVAKLRELGYLATEGGGGRGRAHVYIVLPPPQLNAAHDAGFRSQTRQQTRQEPTSPPFKRQETNKDSMNRKSINAKRSEPADGLARMPEWSEERRQMLEALAESEPSPSEAEPDLDGAEKARRAREGLHG